MSNKDEKQQLPKHRQLEIKLLKRIKDDNLKPHDAFLSQNVICREYGENLPMTRRALANLEQKGVIYRINGKGTFIAPLGKNRTLLLVMGHHHPQLELDNLYEMTFITNFMFAADQTGFLVTIVHQNEFLNRIDDLEMVYPNLAGLVFIRSHKVWEMTREKLIFKGIPFIHYNSDYHPHNLADVNILTSERKVGETAMRYLAELGHRRVAILRPDNEIAGKRMEYCQEWDRENQAFDSLNVIIYHKHGDLKHKQALINQVRESGATALYCAHDYLALDALWVMREAGLRSPNDFSVLGTLDLQPAQLHHPKLTTVRYPIAEDAERCFTMLEQWIVEENRPESYWSELTVTERESAVPWKKI